MFKLIQIIQKSPRTVSALSAVVVVTGLIGLDTALGSGPSNPPLDLPGATASTLAAGGLVITAAHSPTPPGMAIASAASAAATAHRDMHANARDSRYAHCSADGAVPPVDEDCWVVSLDPSNLRSHGPGSSTQPATYLVELIDPATGNVLVRQGGAP